MNRLERETSPYLLQHASNPVAWYPWGQEALKRARREDRPLFLSSGYSACHWCHVMAHESFEDPGTADLLNAHFIAVKLDREERPDLDALYMRSLLLMQGTGGWPLNLFLTPDLKPFFGGSYFPPDRRHGMASFREVLEAVSSAFQERRDERPRQPRLRHDGLACHGIPLVRHRARPDLTAVVRLFQLHHLRFLQQHHFVRDPAHGAGDQRHEAP